MSSCFGQRKRALAKGAARRYISAMSKRENGGSSEVRRKRLLYRAERRGFREAGLIFGAFAAAELSGLSGAELDQFEALLNAHEQDVYDWLRGAAPVPPEFDTAVFHRMKALCAQKNPAWKS